MKIVTVLGARPQFVKAAVVSRAFKEKGIEEVIVHTGQHFDANMSAVFFEEMQIPEPHYNLDINGVGHGAMTGRMLEEIERILAQEKPTCVLVYGDTNSTLAGALAAKKMHIKVAHVEAGLRSFNMEMPEEINRILTDRISDFLFVPTDTGLENLEREGFENLPVQIEKTGDVMQDAAQFYAVESERKSSIMETIKLNRFGLVTLHRAENTDDPKRLEEMLKALDKIQTSLPLVWPVHPRTAAKMKAYGLETQLHCIDPVGYFDMIELLKKSSLVLTDSGGLQKEAYFFETPCITMRDQTEWVELVEGGYNVITGADYQKIIQAKEEMLSRQLDFSVELYGGGKAGERIVNTLCNALSEVTA